MTSRPRSVIRLQNEATPGSGITFASTSISCDDAMPGTVIENSVNSGWTSVLLQVRRSPPTVAAFDTAVTADQRIVVQTRGHCTLGVADGRSWRTAVNRPGSLGMTPGGCSTRLKWQAIGSLTDTEFALLYLPVDFLRGAAEHYRRAGQRTSPHPLDALAFADPAIAHAVIAMRNAIRKGTPDLYAEISAQWLATHLLSAHSPWLDLADDPRRVAPLSDSRLQAVVEFMGDHLHERLTLAQLAAQASTSKYHFARLFREKTGTAPYIYLTRLRMDLARRLLATTDLPVAAVSKRSGYPDAGNFSTAFRARFGCTPSTYRSRRRTSVES